MAVGAQPGIWASGSRGPSECGGAIGPIGLAGVVGLVWLTTGLRTLGELLGFGAGGGAGLGRQALRVLPLAALALLPTWAALGTGQGVAELPGAGVDIDWRMVAVMLDALDSSGAQALTPATAPPSAGSAPLVAFPPTVARWRELVEREIEALRGVTGLHEAVTADLVLAVIAAESGGDPGARSPAQAVGLMQVLPTTLASLVARTPIADGHDAVREGGRLDPSDPRLNVRAGILYLDEAVRRHEGDVAWGLAGYNAGISASLRARALGAPLWPESDRFVARVMAALPPGAAW
jgi:hypothetical protein